MTDPTTPTPPAELVEEVLATVCAQFTGGLSEPSKRVARVAITAALSTPSIVAMREANERLYTLAKANNDYARLLKAQVDEMRGDAVAMREALDTVPLPQPAAKYTAFEQRVLDWLKLPATRTALSPKGNEQ